MTAGLLSLAAAACLRNGARVGVVPPAVDSLEGHASWRLEREGASARSRLSFLFVLPDRGLIEIGGPLNRTVSRLLVDGETAYLVIPGKRAYWPGSRAEVMTRLIGFEIAPAELAALLTGRDRGLEGWTLESDERGRAVRGRRDDLAYSVDEFFEGSRVPRTVVFDGATDRGRLKIIRLRFNPPLREDALRPDFLDDGRYRAVGWPEIEGWLRDED